MTLQRHMPTDEPSGLNTSIDTGNTAGVSPPLMGVAGLDDLSARLRLLARIEGSASTIARRCGFSVRTFQSWCAGRNAPTREHCIAMAKKLNVSLHWLVAGEGPMKAVPDAGTPTPMQHPPLAPLIGTSTSNQARTDAPIAAVDVELLASTFRVLNSYVNLAGGVLPSDQRAEATARLYQLLSISGLPGHAERMIEFHSTLASYLRSGKSLVG